MKELILLFLLFCLIVSCKQQKTTNINNKGIYITYCGYTDAGNANISRRENAGLRETIIAKQICAYSGVKMNFDLYIANVKYALATIEEGKRIIYYDKNLFKSVSKNHDSYWYAISIIAHEIGHHLNMHFEGNLKSQRDREMEADKFSGFILNKMGATKNQSLYALGLLRENIDTFTHPSFEIRCKILLDGWEAAQKMRDQFAAAPISIPDMKSLEMCPYEFFFTKRSSDTEYCWFMGEEDGNYDIQEVEKLKQATFDGIVLEQRKKYGSSEADVLIEIISTPTGIEEKYKNQRLWFSITEEDCLSMCRACMGGFYSSLNAGNMLRFKFKSTNRRNQLLYLVELVNKNTQVN